MNLLALRTAAYDLLLMSATENLASTTELTRYINQAQNRLHQRVAAKQLNFFSVTADLSEVVDATTINLPTDLYEIQYAERIGGGGSSERRPVPMRRIRKSNDSTYETRHVSQYGGVVNRRPLHYIMEGRARIRLVPTPQEALTGYIRLYYVFKPAEMVSDTHVPFQQSVGTGGAGKDDLAEYHDILYLMAARRVAAKEESSNVYGMISNELNERLQELDDYLATVDNSPRWVQTGIDDHMMFDY